MSRTVCVVTTSRAEYGLLEPVARAIAERRGLRLKLVVSGAHFSRAFGRTERAIRLPIAARVPMPVGDDAVRWLEPWAAPPRTSPACCAA